jgi:hypothetical protein
VVNIELMDRSPRADWLRRRSWRVVCAREAEVGEGAVADEIEHELRDFAVDDME